MKLHYYKAVHYNPKTEEQLNVYFMAEDYFDAEKRIPAYQSTPGFEFWALFYVENGEFTPDQWSFLNALLKDNKFVGIPEEL